MSDALQAYHFFLDYARAHDLLQREGIIGRDRKMLDVDRQRVKGSDFTTVSGRLLKVALQYYFPDWVISKPRGVHGYILGDKGGGGQTWSRIRNCYTWAIPIDPTTPQGKVITALAQVEEKFDRAGRLLSNQRIHADLITRLTALQDEAAESPHRATLFFDEYDQRFHLTLSDQTSGLYKLITCLPALKAICNEAIDRADNADEFGRQRNAAQDAKRNNFNELYLTLDPQAYTTEHPVISTSNYLTFNNTYWVADSAGSTNMYFSPTTTTTTGT